MGGLPGLVVVGGDSEGLTGLQVKFLKVNNDLWSFVKVTFYNNGLVVVGGLQVKFFKLSSLSSYGKTLP